MKSVKSRFIITVIVAFIILVIILLYFYLFNNYNISIPCPIHKLTGLHCPGCGATRMVGAILELNFYQAFRYNPLLFLFIPFILLLIFDKLIGWIRNKKTIFYDKIGNKVWYTLLVIAILYGIIRNVPGFEYLMPLLL